MIIISETILKILYAALLNHNYYYYYYYYYYLQVRLTFSNLKMTRRCLKRGKDFLRRKEATIVLSST